MSKLYDLKELVRESGMSERTVRYYLAKVLDAPGGTPGRKAYYPQEFLDQLLLAKHVLMREYDPKRGEVKPSLRAFRDWLEGLSSEEIREMLEMPYRFKPKSLVSYETSISRRRKKVQQADAAPVQVHAKLSGGIGEPKRSHYPGSQKPGSQHADSDPGEPAKKPRSDSAADYLDRLMGPAQHHSGRRRQGLAMQRQSAAWHRYHFGDDLEIRTRKHLSPEQEKQLRLVGELLRSTLKESKS